MRRMLIFLLLSILLLASCELVQDQPPQGKGLWRVHRVGLQEYDVHESR